MYTPPVNDKFKSIFRKAAEEKNLTLLKELKMIGDNSFTWGKMATFEVWSVNETETVMAALPKYVSMTKGQMILQFESDFFTVIERKNLRLNGEPVSEEAFEALKALVMEWANTGSISTIK